MPASLKALSVGINGQLGRERGCKEKQETLSLGRGEGCGGPGAPGIGSEQIVAAIGQETGVVAVVRALANLLLAGSFLVAQLGLGYCVEKAFMLVTGLFSANAQGDTRNHPAPFDLETWASQGCLAAGVLLGVASGQAAP